jgi:O-antigen ligase
MPEPEPAAPTPTDPRRPSEAEVLLLTLVALSPWPYGCAPDVFRYLLLALVFAAGALWCASLARSGRGLPPFALVATLPLALGAVQVAFVRRLSLVEWAEATLLATGALVVLVFWSQAAYRHGARRLAGVVLATCAAEAAFGAIQWSETPGRLYGRLVPIVTSPFGSFVNHNHFAGLMEMGAVLSMGATLGLARRDGLNAKVLGALGLTVGLVVAQFASGSRGGLLALVAGFAALGALFSFWVARRGTALRVGLAALGLSALLAGSFAALSRETAAHLQTLASGTSDPAAAYRIDVASDTLRLFRAHPILGVGLGNFPDAFPGEKRSHGLVRTTHAEDDVAEALAEGGLLGASLLLGVSGLAARRFSRLLEGSRDPLWAGFSMGAAGALAALLVHSFLDFNLRIPSNALVFSSLAGIVAAGRADDEAPTRRWTSLTAALLLVAGSGIASLRALGAVDLDRALGLGDPSLRIGALDNVLRLHPDLAEGFHERGLAWLSVAGGNSSAMDAGRLARARGDLLQALSLRPAWGEAWSDLGWALYRMGRVAEARDAFATSVALDPTNVRVGIVHAEFLARESGTLAAVGELVRVEQANPDWPKGNAAEIARRWTDDRALLARLVE